VVKRKIFTFGYTKIYKEFKKSKIILPLFLNKIEVYNFEKKDKFPKIWNPKRNFLTYYQNLQKLNLQKRDLN